MSEFPFPCNPIPARLSLSLGAVNPVPPRTCLGTIKSDDAKAEFLINFLLDFFDEAIVFIFCFMNLIKNQKLFVFFEPLFNS